MDEKRGHRRCIDVWPGHPLHHCDLLRKLEIFTLQEGLEKV